MENETSRFRRFLEVLAVPFRLPGKAWDLLVADKGRRVWGAPVFALSALALLYLALTPVVMVLGHQFPGPSQSVVPARTAALSGAAESTTEPPPAATVQGLAFVDALLHVHDAGMVPWLPNDRFYPTVFLDNPQSFQTGELEAMRHAVRVLRDHLCRQRSTDSMDEDVMKAHNLLNIDSEAWMFPKAEAKYAEAMEHLRSYRRRLITGEAHFFPRADNLVELLNQFNSLTGHANTGLYNCSGARTHRISEETMGDQYLQGEKIIRTDVPWSEVDNKFYYARGVAFVYREILQAVTVDFDQVLRMRNADEMARSIVVDFLDLAQFEPIYIASGSYDSLWANHPYKLLGLLSQVRERSRSLVTMLNVQVN